MEIPKTVGKTGNFEIFLLPARKGKTCPSRGAGMSMEKLVNLIVGAGYIDETQPFPKILGIIYGMGRL